MSVHSRGCGSLRNTSHGASCHTLGISPWYSFHSAHTVPVTCSPCSVQPHQIVSVGVLEPQVHRACDEPGSAVIHELPVVGTPGASISPRLLIWQCESSTLPPEQYLCHWYRDSTTISFPWYVACRHSEVDQACPHHPCQRHSFAIISGWLTWTFSLWPFTPVKGHRL